MHISDKLKIFFSITLIFSIIYLFLILQNKVSIAHDTFQYLQLQYVYFNEVVQNHSLPLWFPYTSRGITGNYYFLPQLTLLSPLFYLLGLFVKGINYLYLFYLALWFEELFFLLGVILLSSLYYKDSRTIFFVSLTLLGTNIWYPQIWWNFHQYYFIPIVLYSIHQAILTRLFRYFIYALVFFTLAVYGNFIYCGIFVSFVIWIYILCLIPLNFSEIKMFLSKKVTLRNFAIPLVLFTIISLSLFYIRYAEREIVYVGSGRDSYKNCDLNTFLTYGGALGLDKYKDIFRRSGDSFGDSDDINLYAGFLLVPFVLISLLYARSKLSLAVGGTALVVFLFSIGTFVAKSFYYLYPFGSIFRHIGLTATVFKLFIVFYAGFGLEIFLERISTEKKMVGLLLLYLLSITWFFISQPYVMSPQYFWFISKFEKIVLATIPYALISSGVILCWLMYRTRISKNHFIALLLWLMAIDFFSYKYAFIVTRMPGVSSQLIGLFKPQRYDFLVQRLPHTGLYLKDNQRMQQFNSHPYRRGAIYNTTESFLFTDSAASLYRTDFLLKSQEEYYETIAGLSGLGIIDAKFSGLIYPKLDVFSRLNLVEDESEFTQIFNLETFTADMLFVREKDIAKIKKTIPLTLIHRQNHLDFKNRFERLSANIEIKSFSFNHLRLNVSVDGPRDKSCFLYYSDTYHPHWNVSVNGKRTPVIKANIAYKSVMIPYGRSEVTFNFGNMLYCISIYCTIIMGIIILALTSFIFITELICS